MNAAIVNPTIEEQVFGRHAHPAAVDFAVSLRRWIATDTILIDSVDAAASGVIDLVLVGPS